MLARPSDSARPHRHSSSRSPRQCCGLATGMRAGLVATPIPKPNHLIALSPFISFSSYRPFYPLYPFSFIYLCNILPLITLSPLYPFTPSHFIAFIVFSH